MIQDKNDVLTAIRNNQSKLETFGVKKLALFGSFARNQQNRESDIDLLVEFEQGQKNFDNFAHIVFLMEDILEHHVELVTPESLNPYIKAHIINEVEYVFPRP